MRQNERLSVMYDIAACVDTLMMPLNVVLNAKAMLKAASVVVGSPSRARNACTSECES